MVAEGFSSIEEISQTSPDDIMKIEGIDKNTADELKERAGEYLAKEKENIVHYYNTNYRSPKHEIGILWNDPLLKIKWPTKKPILSKKDKINLTLKQFLKK